MKRVVFHFWVQAKDGTRMLYEVDYWVCPNAVGVSRFMRIEGSTRKCTCVEQDVLSRRPATRLTS